MPCMLSWAACVQLWAASHPCWPQVLVSILLSLGVLLLPCPALLALPVLPAAAMSLLPAPLPLPPMLLGHCRGCQFGSRTPGPSTPAQSLLHAEALSEQQNQRKGCSP